MMRIRPVEGDDLDALEALSGHTSFGLTTLPPDRALLAKRVRAATRGFALLAENQNELGDAYLFVMEDTRDGRILGTAGIDSKVGGFEPFYTYRIETRVHASTSLGVRKEIDTLNLVEDHDGPCEIGSLFLHPEARGGGHGRALSLSRFLLMAERPEAFDPVVIAEMRGVIDEEGHSPFWDAVGRHFFDIEFAKADALSMANKEFIGGLMPRAPLYIPLLPAEARAVVGEVHERTRPARRLLETEGFAFSRMVDIFEAGPVLRAPRDRIRAVRESTRSVVYRIAPTGSREPSHVVSRGAADFRAAASPLRLGAEGAVVPPETAEALEIEAGDPIRALPLRPPGAG